MRKHLCKYYTDIKIKRNRIANQKNELGELQIFNMGDTGNLVLSWKS